MTVPSKTAVAVVQESLKNGKPTDVVESSVVAAFCTLQNFTFLTPSKPDSDLVQEFMNTGDISIDDLVQCYEALLPSEEATVLGATYTPVQITRFMAESLVTRMLEDGKDLTNVTVLDPSVGVGALLVAMMHALHSRTGEQPSSIVNRFTGVDVAKDSLRRVQTLLTLACRAMGDTSKVTPNLIHDDFLFPEKEPLEEPFDAVIANPPYVRYQRLTEDARERLSDKYISCEEGNFNLYFPFFEQSSQMVKRGGHLVFITPNGFLTSLSGRTLRQWFAHTGMIDQIVDFQHHRVFSAQIYTAITFLTARTIQEGTTSSVVGYLPLTGLEDLGSLPANWATSDKIARHPITVTDKKGWELFGKKQAQVVRRMREQPRTLSQIADVRFGIATSRDGLYLLSGKRTKTGNYLTSDGHEVEHGLTIPCIKVPHIKNECDLRNTSGRVIYPYHRVKGKAIIMEEDYLASTYPLGYAYFQTIKAELALRDKGKKPYAAWYAFGRTQGIVPVGPQLLTPLYAKKPRFMLSSSTDSLFINGCGITIKPHVTDVTLPALQVILNSKVTQSYVEATAIAISGGYYSYQKIQLANVGIPVFTISHMNTILSLTTESERDHAIADMYGLKNFT